MNETMSLLFATGILAVGAAGLYMYKGSSEEDTTDEEERPGDSWFKIILGNDDESETTEKDNKTDEKPEKPQSEEAEETKGKTRANKTKRTKRSSGTKRRYY